MFVFHGEIILYKGGFPDDISGKKERLKKNPPSKSFLPCPTDWFKTLFNCCAKESVLLSCQK
jgi:hypothetical protein